MAIEEKNALELVFSYTVTPGDTEVIIDGMDNKNETYLLIINNVADSDDGASIYLFSTSYGNVNPRPDMAYAGRQLVNGTNTNQHNVNAQPLLVNYGNTGSQYETNGHAWIYPQTDLKIGETGRNTITGKMTTYNDTNLVSHDIYLELSTTGFGMNGIKLFPSSGAWDSGEFRLFQLRTGN
jgi:hypothetical protein